MKHGSVNPRVSPAACFEGLLSLEQVAAWCSVSCRTVRRWMDDGLPVHRLPGKGARPIVRIAREDLNDWIRRHRFDPSLSPSATQTIRLDGRRFLGADKKTAALTLDDRRRSRPRVTRQKQRHG